MAWVTVALMGAGFGLSLALAPWFYAWSNKLPWRVQGWFLATGAYLGGLVGVTQLPLAPVSADGVCLPPEPRLDWFNSVSRAVQTWQVQGRSGLSAVFSADMAQWLLNVLMMVPLPVLVVWGLVIARPQVGRFLVQAPWWWLVAGSLVLGYIVSWGIELAQWVGVFAPCPHRVVDVDDVLLNTVGAVLGGIVLVWAVASPRVQRVFSQS